MLEDFKVTDVLILELGVPVNFVHGHTLLKGIIEKLAIDGTRA